MAMCNTAITNQQQIRVCEVEDSNGNGNGIEIDIDIDNNDDSGGGGGGGAGGGRLCFIRMKIADVSFYWFHGQD